MVKVLDNLAFKRALDTIARCGRPLERAYARFLFERGPVADVLTELSRFQNDDGGFFGLEPDLRTGISSPIATSVAWQILDAVDAPSSHSLVQAAYNYTVRAFDRETLAWNAVGPAANDAPHAPWWTFDPATGKTQAGSLANPSAELAGVLLRRAGATLASPDWLPALVDRLQGGLLNESTTMEMHDLLCYLHFYAALPTGVVRDRLADKLTQAGQAIVTRDPAAWSGYGVKPLWLASTPEGLLAEPLRADVDANLDWEIEHQADNGGWEPNWSWFGSYPDVWPEAAREWTGVLTIKVLRQLAAYNRIGG